MKYLLSQGLLLILSVIVLLYLFTVEGFLPVDRAGKENWYNISTVLILLFIATESLVSIVITVVLKAFILGRNGIINNFWVTKWAVAVSIALTLLILLNIFNFLPLGWGIIIVVLIFIGIVLLR